MAQEDRKKMKSALAELANILSHDTAGETTNTLLKSHLQY
jgi:hypothetical protein